MDGKRFDHLAKELSSGSTRRRVLGGLGAVAAGLVTTRTASAKARPVNNGNGCAQPGRICTPEGGCCGSKLTCAPPTGLSGSCGNTLQNNKCCSPVGTACHGHCECCLDTDGGNTKCRNGRCTRI